MQIPVLIEPLPDGRGFRAKTGDPFDVTAEAQDRAGAVEGVRRRLADLIVAGKLVPVDVESSNPMAKPIGTLDLSDPRSQRWWEYVQEFRRECDGIVLPGEGDEDGA